MCPYDTDVHFSANIPNSAMFMPKIICPSKCNITHMKVFSEETKRYSKVFDFIDANTVLEENQAGYRAGFSTMDHSFCIACINRNCKNSEKRNSYVCFDALRPRQHFFSHVGIISCPPGFKSVLSS